MNGRVGAGRGMDWTDAWCVVGGRAAATGIPRAVTCTALVPSWHDIPWPCRRAAPRLLSALIAIPPPLLPLTCPPASLATPQLCFTSAQPFPAPRPPAFPRASLRPFPRPVARPFPGPSQTTYERPVSPQPPQQRAQLLGPDRHVGLKLAQRVVPRHCRDEATQGGGHLQGQGGEGGGAGKRGLGCG